jgi:2-keto-4-pentenoate hydratase/2-oxohepta-3-ene-1,7-dioic acid hydratase in catechol pathway
MLKMMRPAARRWRTLSKQMCAKPVGPRLWSYADVKPHWEKLTLRSFVPGEGGKRRLYQEGSAATMRSPEELIKLYTGSNTLAAGTAMFCGTLPARGGVSYANCSRWSWKTPCSTAG